MYDDNLKLIPHIQLLVTNEEYLQIMHARHKKKVAAISVGRDYIPSESELNDAAYAKDMEITA